MGGVQDLFAFGYWLCSPSVLVVIPWLTVPLEESLLRHTTTLILLLLLLLHGD